MKVLLFDFGYYSTPHLETETEILQLHRDKGDEVVRVACNRELPVCMGNPEHELTRCAVCLCRRRAAASMIHPQIPERPVINLTAKDQETVAGFTFHGNRLSDLKVLTFGPFDIGMAVASHLIDATKNPDPDLAPIHQRVDDWIGVCLAVYLSTMNTLEEEQPDRVYVMNGRWTYARAVLRACQTKGVECHLHERGGDTNRYWVVVNRLPHEIAGTAASIEDVWQAGQAGEREAIGRIFFEEKARGVERQWTSFVADQKRGAMPESWDPFRRNIAVFMSSEFEFAAIGPDYANRLYKDQNDALAKIVASLESANAPVHLNIRVHPNMKGIRNANLEWLLALRSPTLTIIPPESPVSSYALLWECEKTLVFGSTMGIEAVYWGKPSILAGPAVYHAAGGTFNPNSHEELLAMLLAELTPKPQEAALKYGYHELRKGIKHVYYEPETPFEGKFKGRYVNETFSWFQRVVDYFARKHKVRIALRWLGQLHRRWLRARLGMVDRANRDRLGPAESKTNRMENQPTL